MKNEEIKIGHIYFVDFDPVEKGEFNGPHLAIVLKKNADKITFITIPLTSKEKGLDVNKISLGKLDCLPENLREKESFAVIDQIRTVSANRFSELHENSQTKDAKVPDKILVKIYRAVIKDFLRDVPDINIRDIFFG